MAVKVTLPNVKQPITDGSGYVTKAHFDFLRSLWNRTGGNEDSVSNIQDDNDIADVFIYITRVEKLEKRIADLEKQMTMLGI